LDRCNNFKKTRVDPPLGYGPLAFQTMREIEVLSPSRAEAPPDHLPPEWIEQLKILSPRYIVPSSCQFIQESWSWYNHAFFPISYRQFKSEVESAIPDTRVVRLNPSVAVTLTENSLTNSPPLPWINPVGEQDVDYEFQSRLKPPTTAEISRHFAPLEPSHTERVLSYCRSGAIERFQGLEASEETYFKALRLWRLSIYDHNGRAVHFQYRLNDQRMELISEGATFTDDDSLAWITEIPIAKLYAALELGECLTTMYLRINDKAFAPDIEKEIASVDLVEDPLIRCLFTGNFGAYQKAQLKRLINTV
jgi:hypothetical protein